MREADFQRKLKSDIEKRFPGSIILKNDPSHFQGIPDLLVLYKDRWAALEVKKENKSKRQPNQPRYIQMMNDMSYASFVSKENEEDVLNEMERSFKTKR